MFTTYDIFDDMLSLRNWVDRFFVEHPVTSRWVEYPYVNLYEGNDTVEISALLPGVKADSLNIQMLDNSIVIEGEKPSDVDRDKTYIRRERSFGKFQKSVKLPYKVDAGKVDANLRDGILTIKLVKSEEAKPRRIAIS